MKKALEILTNLLKQKYDDRPFVFGVEKAHIEIDNIHEAIAELEEAQLTRREWYQKGYAEAMKPKTCKGCVYGAEDMQDQHCVFCSRSCDDKFEPKDNA